MKSFAKILLIVSILTFSITLPPAKPDFVYLKNLHWLALNIYYESGNQPALGKIAVGVVTLNRIRDPRFSDTIEEVVKEHKQFSWYKPNKTYSPKDPKTWSECLEISKMLLKIDENHAIMRMFEGVTHFHASYVKPEWRKSMTKVTQIGDHIFYKTKP